MRSMQWRQRFFATTRGRVVSLLRRGTHTVGDLAEALHLTDNALRGHLATLERDGLVERRGLQRGTGKPAALYGLSPEAEALFPQSYGLVLRSLLEAMADRLPTAQREALIEDAGRRSAPFHADAAGDARARLEAAVAAYAELGGLAEIEEQDGRLVLTGFGCPIAQVTSEHGEMCRLVAALLSELTGLPVVERCERGGSPRCRFEVARERPAL